MGYELYSSRIERVGAQCAKIRRHLDGRIKNNLIEYDMADEKTGGKKKFCEVCAALGIPRLTYRNEKKQLEMDIPILIKRINSAIILIAQGDAILESRPYN